MIYGETGSTPLSLEIEEELSHFGQDYVMFIQIHCQINYNQSFTKI
jgi:hypothetical protein